METRQLRYFVAVAEALNFSRAARRLGMSQPPLSRAIQQLERRLGTTLLERDSQAVRLTPSGAVLLREARVAIAAVDAAMRRTQRAGKNPDLPLARWPEPDGSYTDGPGPQIHDPLQLLHLVALGRTCAVICETCPTTIGSTELTVVPVPEADPVTTVLAWPAHSRSGALADLVRTATP